MQETFILEAPHEEALSIASGRFKKALAKVGNYIHPATNQRIDITTKRAQHWVDQYNLMKSRGRSIPIFDEHWFPEDANDKNPAELTIGSLDDVWLEPDGWLMGLVTLMGEGIDLALKNKQVSIGASPFVDEQGNKYDQIVHHVAVTPFPVIPQPGKDFEPVANDWKRIAASSVCMYSLDIPKRKATNMNKEQTAIATEAIGEEITKENFLDKFVALSIEVKELRAVKDQLKQFELSAVPKSNPEIDEQWARIYEARAERCLQETRITQEVFNQFKLSILGSKGSRNQLALSTTGARPVSFAEQTVQMFESFPPRIEMGIKTGTQVGILDDNGRSGSKKLDAGAIERFALSGGATPAEAKKASQLIGAF